MKFFYFPNSENLNNHWFHRLIFPLYKICLILFTVGFLGYFLVNSTILLFTVVKANLTDENELSWCGSFLEKYSDNYNITYYSSLNDAQKSLLVSLPKEKARSYAASLDGCLYERKTDSSIKAWASSENNNSLYSLEYAPKTEKLFTDYLSIFGVCLIIYIVLALIPGFIYKYILFVIFGKKLDELLSKKKLNKVKKNNKFKLKYLIYILCGIGILLVGYGLYSRIIQAKKNSGKLNSVQLIPTTTIVDGSNCVKNSQFINGECWCDDGYTLNDSTNQCDPCPPNTWGKYSFCYCNDGYTRKDRTEVCQPCPENSTGKNSECYCNNGYKKNISTGKCDKTDSVSSDNANILEDKSNSVQIDCVGPDGKHFMTTEVKCKEFNDAWSNLKPTLKSEKMLVPTMSNYDNAWCQATIKIYNACLDAYNWCLTQPNTYCPNNCINKPTCSN